MLASVRTTVLPEHALDIYPEFDPYPASHHQRYVLVLRDGTAGALELVFLSTQDLRAFLALARTAFAAAREEVRARQDRVQRTNQAAVQATLF